MSQLVFRTLELKNFRKFSELSLDFVAGINVVFGQNEHGKSTLLLAILTVLYGDVKTKNKKFVQTVKKWNSKMLPVITLGYNFGGSEFRLLKDFEKKEILLENLSKGSVFTDSSEIHEKVLEHTGIANSETYKLTALVQQEEIARVGSELSSLQDGIQDALVGTGNVSMTEAMKKLDIEIVNLDKGLTRPAKHPGKIKTLKDTLSELNTKHKEIAENVKSSKGSKEETKDYSKELKRVETRVEEIETQLQNSKSKIEFEKRLKELNKMIVDLEKNIVDLERLYSKLGAKEEEVKEYSDTPDLSEAKDELSSTLAVKRSKEEELDRLKKEQKEFASEYKTKKSKGLTEAAKYSGAAVLVAAALAAIFSIGIYTLPIAGIASVLLFNFLYFVFPNQVKRDLEIVETSITSYDNDIIDLNNKVGEIYKKYNVSGERELFSTEAKKSAITVELDQIKSSVEILEKDSSLEKIKEEQLELLKEKKEIETNNLTDEVMATDLDQKAKFQLLKELDELKESQVDLQQKMIKEKVEKEQVKYTQEDLDSVESEIDQLNNELKHFEKKSETLKHVKDFLESSVEDVASDSSDIIQGFVKQYIAQLTNDRYKKVRVSEKDLQIEVYSEEKSEWIKPDNTLSRGTIDQIYILARFAIFDIITKKVFPPIFLDDPFITFDESRRYNVKDVLDDLGEKYQVILLTCHKEYEEWGNLIQLD